MLLKPLVLATFRRSSISLRKSCTKPRSLLFGHAGRRLSSRSAATFLTDQVGLRSVTPRSGDSPDAILSRAEAALRSGDLPQTLTELGSLPEAAQAPLSDWMDRARTRADAVAAADGLAQEMNKE